MKAISVRQPWAEMIMQGDKTIEIRKLNTSYRGKLLIHAASIRGSAEFRKANVDPKTKSAYQQQAFIGIVELVEIKPLTRKLWEELRKQHLLNDAWIPDEHKFAWFLKNPMRIVPRHYIGLPAIFEVNDKIVSNVKINK